MNDDSLLHQLAGVARERDAEERERLDERWDRLAAGELSAAEEAELRALAAGDAQGREALAAFTPLGAEFEARMVRALAEKSRAPASVTLAEPEPPVAKTLPFRRRGPGLGVSLAAAAAVAASLALWLAPPSPFPIYAAGPLSGGSQSVRDPEASRSFAPGGTLEWQLRPPTPLAEAVEVRAFLAAPGGELRLWPAAAEISQERSVKIADSLPPGLAPGRWTLWVVVGRAGRLPDAEELGRHLKEATPRARNWAAVQKPLQIQ